MCIALAIYAFDYSYKQAYEDVRKWGNVLAATRPAFLEDLQMLEKAIRTPVRDDNRKETSFQTEMRLIVRRVSFTSFLCNIYVVLIIIFSAAPLS